MGAEDPIKSLDGMTPASSEESVSVPGPSGDPDKPRRTSYDILIRKAVKSMGSKSGSSRRAIIRHILAHQQIQDPSASSAIERGLKRMIKNGKLIKNKSGLYKIPPRGYQAKVLHRRESLRKTLQMRKKKLEKRKKRRRSDKIHINTSNRKFSNRLSTQKKSRKIKKRLKKKEKKKSNRKNSTKYTSPKSSKGRSIKDIRKKQKKNSKSKSKAKKKNKKSRVQRRESELFFP